MIFSKTKKANKFMLLSKIKFAISMLILVSIFVGGVFAADCVYEPCEDNSYPSHIPIQIDYAPNIFDPNLPTEQRITFESANPSDGDFWYYEQVTTTSTLSLAVAGTYKIWRNQGFASGNSVESEQVFEVYNAYQDQWQYPIPTEPQEGEPFPVLNVEPLASEKFFFATDEYGRMNLPMTVRNDGTAPLILYDVLPSLSNSRFHIFPSNFEKDAVIPPGESIEINFDYLVLDREHLLANPIGQIPVVFVSNDYERPTFFETILLYSAPTADDFPAQDPPVPIYRKRECKILGDANGDGVLDASDMMLLYLSEVEQ